MTKLDERGHEELIMLYKNAVDGIERTKREQWSHVCAILLAQVGIAGLTTLRFGPSGGSAKVHIAAGLDGLLGLGLVLVFLHQLRLFRLRGVVARYSERLEPHSKALLEVTASQPFLRIGILVLVIAAMFLVWYNLTILIE